MFRFSTLLFGIGVIMCIPCMMWIVDLWTWVIFGQGITPVEWIIPKERGYDPVGKVIIAIVFVIGGIITMLLSNDLRKFEDRNKE